MKHLLSSALLPLALLASLALAGCGDDGSNSNTPDAASSIDASPDASPIDGSVESACSTFCDDLGRLCPTEASELTDCSTTCQGWAASVQQCRFEHVLYANESAIHCRHAIGDADETSTPAECLE
ncbi:MAG: hypothetical protein Tsb0020_26000 [Haliangiales bacterium]